MLSGIFNNAPTVKSFARVTLLLASSITAFEAGKVQKTSFVPEPKSTLLSLLEEESTVSLDKVSVAASVTVPIPTSNSVVP